MKTYSVYLAPAIKTEKGICANGAKHTTDEYLEKQQQTIIRHE